MCSASLYHLPTVVGVVFVDANRIDCIDWVVHRVVDGIGEFLGIHQHKSQIRRHFLLRRCRLANVVELIPSIVVSIGIPTTNGNI